MQLKLILNAAALIRHKLCKLIQSIHLRNKGVTHFQHHLLELLLNIVV